MSLLKVTDLGVRYPQSVAVSGTSFAIDRGEAVGLVGESGAGKSQTALAILGLLTATADVSGSVQLDGEELLGKTDAELDTVRATRIGMVFQDSTQALNPYVRVGKQLRQILLQHSRLRGQEADAGVIDMLERVGLPDPLRQSRAYSHELSGGMRQRVMIAAALIAEPDLLIADEPTTALDVTVQAQILALLEELRDDTALLLITHDLGVVAGHCERMLVLQQGRLVESGATASIFAAPQHAHTRALLQAAANIGDVSAVPDTAGKPVLTIDAANVRYDGSEQRPLSAVVDVSLQLREAETLAIVGESGSGKSSLVRAMLGLIPMRSGRVVFLGEALPGQVEARTLSVRRDLQLVFQEPLSALSPSMTVQNILGEPLSVHTPAMPYRERQSCVAKCIRTVGLDESLLARYPHQLSGGQAQRVAIARALILKPKVLVCDEAVAALDGTVREQVLRVLRTAQEASGLAIIFISHDLGVVRSISHRVLVMYLGRLAEVATGSVLFAAPRHPYSRALIAAAPIPDPLRTPVATPLSGEVPSLFAPPSGCVFHPRCEFAKDICAHQAPLLRDVGPSRVACHRAEEIQRTLASADDPRR